MFDEGINANPKKMKSVPQTPTYHATNGERFDNVEISPAVTHARQLGVEDSFSQSDELDPFKSGSPSNPPSRGSGSRIDDQIQSLKMTNKRKERKPTMRMQDRKSDMMANENFRSQLAGQQVEQHTNAIEARLLQFQQQMSLEDKKKRKPYMIYPEDKFKAFWDIVITVVLVFTCVVVPVRIAFTTEDTTFWVIVNYSIDFIFVLDIIFAFNTAIYDPNMRTIDDRHELSQIYLRTWFFIDLLGIIPFDQLSKLTGNSDMGRVAKLSRMYKLTKLTKLARVMKLFKKQQKMFQQAQEVLKISVGIERLVNFFMTFFMVIHIVSCLWIMVASFLQDDEGVEVWLDAFDDMSPLDQYLTAVYFTVTTITTVGYGDISAGNTKAEKLFCVLIMVAGVVAFSFASGSLASIIQNYDSQNAKLADQVIILNKLYHEYKLPLELYQRLKLSLQHNSAEEIDHLNSFLEELPHNLKVEISLYIHKDTYKNIYFMKDKSMSFVAWMCPLFKTYMATPQEYIYSEGDEIINMFFMKKGSCGFVLPKYDRTKYIDISLGCDFGTEDIIAGILKTEGITNEEWFQQKEKLVRHFTVMAEDPAEFLLFSISDVNCMQAEFLEAYNKLMDRAYRRLEYALTIKADCIKKSEELLKIGVKLNSGFDASQVKEVLRRTKGNPYSFKPFRLVELDQQELDESIVFIPTDEDQIREQFGDPFLIRQKEGPDGIGEIEEVNPELEQSCSSQSSSESSIESAGATISPARKEESKMGSLAQYGSHLMVKLKQQPTRSASPKGRSPGQTYSTNALALPSKRGSGAGTRMTEPALPDFESLFSDLASKIEKMQNENNKKLDQLRSSYETQISEIRADNATRFKELSSSHKELVLIIREENSAVISQIREEHKAQLYSVEQKIDDMRFQSLHVSSPQAKTADDSKVVPVLLSPQVYYQMMGFNPFSHLLPRASNLHSPLIMQQPSWPSQVSQAPLTPHSQEPLFRYREPNEAMPEFYNKRLFTPPPLLSQGSSNNLDVTNDIMSAMSHKTPIDAASLNQTVEEHREDSKQEPVQVFQSQPLFDSFPPEHTYQNQPPPCHLEEQMRDFSNEFEARHPVMSHTRSIQHHLHQSKVRYLKEIFESTPKKKGEEPSNKIRRVEESDTSNSQHKFYDPHKDQPPSIEFTYEDDDLPAQLSLRSSQIEGDTSRREAKKKL